MALARARQMRHRWASAGRWCRATGLEVYFARKACPYRASDVHIGISIYAVTSRV